MDARRAEAFHARDAYVRESLEVWRAMAPGWERRRAQIEEMAAPVREWLIGELAPRPGDAVLELAAGAGDTGFEAAAIVGARGRLISSDFAPEMVDVARRRGAELGLDNVEYAVLHGERIPLPADSVDGVICRFGYMLMADAAGALVETRRVLRLGGRLALSVWGDLEANPWAAISIRALVTRRHMRLPEPSAPGPFSMASAEVVRMMLARAGFNVVHIEEVPVRFSFRDVDDYMAFATLTAGPLAMVLTRLSRREREIFLGQLVAEFVPFRGDSGYELPGVALNAVAS